MCTVSWSFKNQGYRLYFNRDEQRSRTRAERPRLVEWKGTELIAPIDPQGGGSWIALNRNGIIAFVLNNYAATRNGDGAERFRSRGEIPLTVASQSDFLSCVRSIETFGNDSYRPFLVGVLSAQGGVTLTSWNGVTLEAVDVDRSFVTTSSYRSLEVESYRQNRYEELKASNGEGWAWSQAMSYHQDLAHSDPAFNPLMARDDAETHCISVITATSENSRFEYWERIADTNGFSREGVQSFGQ
jgi:hypothetical protein